MSPLLAVRRIIIVCVNALHNHKLACLDYRRLLAAPRVLAAENMPSRLSLRILLNDDAMANLVVWSRRAVACSWCLRRPHHRQTVPKASPVFPSFDAFRLFISWVARLFQKQAQDIGMIVKMSVCGNANETTLYAKRMQKVRKNH